MHRYVRDPFSGLSHVVAALAAVAGTVLLWLNTAGGTARRLPMLIYGLTLAGLFTASAVYHLVRGPAARVAFLRKLDHSAIYLLIAGTYTPTATLVLGGAWRIVTLAVVWTLALAGVIRKLFDVGGHRWLNTALYVGMGWLGLVLIGQLRGALPVGALVWMLLGGAVYTAGAVLYALKRPVLRPGVFGFHELWHLFVIGGALCHYLMALVYLAPGGIGA